MSGSFARVIGVPVARALALPPPLTRDVTVSAVAIRARDGVVLRTDHYAPRLSWAPTVLMRTPYGRGSVSALGARVIAERGFHVVVSSCRGTGGSGGTFDPLRHERDDGLDTVEWLRGQPWFTGRFGTFGPSYLGYTQWAIADVPELAAMATATTASQFRGPTYAGHSFSLFTTLAWASLIEAQNGGWLANTVELLRGQPRLHQALAHLPLGEVDQVATGRRVAFFRRWLELADGPPENADTYWATLGHEHRLAAVRAEVLMVAGWQDIFLPWQLRDYAALRAGGAQPRLIIGPWHHGSRGLVAATLRESVRWLRTHLRGESSESSQSQSSQSQSSQSQSSQSQSSQPARRSVRLSVVGSSAWREYDDWPPSPSSVHTLYPVAGGVLSKDVPADGPDDKVSMSDTFRYDPADPTPSVGGPLLVGNLAGARDNRAVERRRDVLVYTSAPLPDDLDAIGPVTATVRLRASGPHLDVFVRLCDVHPTRAAQPGRSLNVSDALVRLDEHRHRVASDGTRTVEIDLWPTAYRFRAGHRVRLQISGGAFPRYARNTGTGESLTTAVQARPVTIEVLHGRHTAVHLPLSATGRSRPRAAARAW